MKRIAFVTALIGLLASHAFGANAPPTTPADETPAPITAIDGLTVKPDAFRGGRWRKPTVVASEKDAAAVLTDKAVKALAKQVDFDKQVVLVFAWQGSGQDKLTYAVLESSPQQVQFKFTPGRTKDLRRHVKVFALRKNVKWTPPKARR